MKNGHPQARTQDDGDVLRLGCALRSSRAAVPGEQTSSHLTQVPSNYSFYCNATATCRLLMRAAAQIARGQFARAPVWQAAGWRPQCRRSNLRPAIPAWPNWALRRSCCSAARADADGRYWL